VIRDLFDPGCGIRDLFDPESGILDGKIPIRDPLNVPDPQHYR
jgi:hypothetical protein